jgi:hypothetical protein
VNASGNQTCSIPFKIYCWSVTHGFHGGISFGDWVPQRLDGCREPLSPTFYTSAHECELSRSWKLARFRSSCGHIFGACAGFYAALAEKDVEIAWRAAPGCHRR